jgi:hypothetical protein
MSQPRVPQLSVVMPSVVMLRVIAPSLRCASQLKNERVVKNLFGVLYFENKIQTLKYRTTNGLSLPFCF